MPLSGKFGRGEAPIATDPGEPALSDPLGSTRKRCTSSRLTIASAQVPVLVMAAAVLGPWYPASAKIQLMKGKEAACAPIEDEQSAVAILHRCDFASRPLTYRANGVILSEI